MNSGYIYILGNKQFQENLLKIGRTTRSPDERMDELKRATGVPRSFSLLYAEYIIDCVSAEQTIHESLKESRQNNKKEFFLIDLERAIAIIQDICKKIRINHNQNLPLVSYSPVVDDVKSIRKPNKTSGNIFYKELGEERELCRNLMPDFMKKI